MCVVANFDESGIIGIHPCAITSHSLGKRFMAKRTTTNIMGGGGVKESILAMAPAAGGVVKAFLDVGCCQFCHETLPL